MLRIWKIDARLPLGMDELAQREFDYTAEQAKAEAIRHRPRAIVATAGGRTWRYGVEGRRKKRRKRSPQP